MLAVTSCCGDDNMTLNQLKYYVEIVKESSFTKAAEKLFVSQSTLSKSVRALEEEFQIKLIHRAAKEFVLTQEGYIFFEYAERILGYYQEQTEELFQRLHNANGELKLGMPPTAGAIFFYSVLHRFKKKYPGIAVNIEEITSKSIQELTDSGELDMGVVIEPFEDRRFCRIPVYMSEAVLLVSREHPLADRKEATFAEIAKEELLMVTPDYMFYDVVRKKYEEAGFVPRISFESYQWEWIFEMVADNQGISILPKPLIDKFNGTRVHQIHLREPEFPWALSIIYRKDKFVTVPMQCFLDMCLLYRKQ